MKWKSQENFTILYSFCHLFSCLVANFQVEARRISGSEDIERVKVSFYRICLFLNVFISYVSSFHDSIIFYSFVYKKLKIILMQDLYLFSYWRFLSTDDAALHFYFFIS